MKKMKYLFLFVITAMITQCKSTQFDTYPPFKIDAATYSSWNGGRPGVSGINVFIEYQSSIQVEFDSIYFKNKATKIQLILKNNNTAIAGYFSTSSKKNQPDLVLHKDSKKELKNNIPSIKQFPFQLKENEAVISYKQGGKTKYFKVIDLKKIKSDFYQ